MMYDRNHTLLLRDCLQTIAYYLKIFRLWQDHNYMNGWKGWKPLQNYSICVQKKSLELDTLFHWFCLDFDIIPLWQPCQKYIRKQLITSKVKLNTIKHYSSVMFNLTFGFCFDCWWRSMRKEGLKYMLILQLLIFRIVCLTMSKNSEE